MASTPRWGGLRPEPYKQNAVDADGDGIVQEGTAFERPAGTSLLDGAGSPLSDGLSSLERDTSWSVVDRNGQRISYTPSYGGAFEQAKPKTLKDSVGTLAVSLGTIGDRVGTVETSSRSIKAQFGTITEMPEPSPIPQVPIPEVEDSNVFESFKIQSLDNYIQELMDEGVPGYLAGSNESGELYRQWEDGLIDIDDSELQDRMFEIEENARNERFDRLEDVTSAGAVNTLRTWIDGQDGATRGIRDDAASPNPFKETEDFVEMIKNSPIRTESLFRGMMIDEGELNQILNSGRINFPVGATSSSISSSSEYAGITLGDGANSVLFEINDAPAFPAHLFSRVDENEWLVSGDFEVVGEYQWKPDNALSGSSGTRVIKLRPAGPAQDKPLINDDAVLPVRSIKAQQIISKLEESGGTWGKITEDYLNANDSDSRLFFPRITDKDTSVRLERMKYILDDLRELIASQTLQPNNKRIQELDEGSVKYFSPEVLQLVEKMSDEELVGLLTEQAVKFHGGIEKNVRVRVNPGSSFFSILDDGYKTTHEVQSDHSGADIRSQYEVVAGVPLSAPIEVRPASGYIVHPDWREKHLDTLRSAREFRGESGEMTEFYDTIRGTASEAGGVGIYGSIEIVLKPEVSERTKFGRGDSLNTILRPTAIDETDKDVIANAIFSADGKEQYYLVPQMASFLQSYIDGNFKKSNLHPMYGDDGLITEFSKDSEFGGREYHEALIFGSFDSSDIQEINVSYEDLFTLAVSSRDQGMDSMNALAEELKSEFLSPNFLDSVGFSQEERRLIDELIEKASRETLVTKRMYKNIPSQISNAFEQLIKFRESKKIRDDIEARGIKINVMSTQNVDMFNAANYRGGSAGDDIEELLYDRSINNLKNSIARELERINNPVTNNFGGSSV